MSMDVEERFDLITRDLEETLTEDDLRALLNSGAPVKHYIGFEISGKVHLGTGLMCMSKVKDFMDAGVDCTVFLADWHTWINDKLGGDREVIRSVAEGYFKEALKASLAALGGNPEKLKFVLGSDLYHHNDLYWETVIDVSKHVTLKRALRSITIMGRKQGEGVDFAKLIYPSMQVADIFIQGVNLAHAGSDQRKAQVVAREVAQKLKSSPLLDSKGNKAKPVAVHHHLLLGLKAPPTWPVPRDGMQELWSEMKMSKSVPDSAVFVHDDPEEVRRKIRAAFCPAGEADFNPVLDWAKYLVFRRDRTLEVKRPAKYGGDVQFESYDELERAFVGGKLHPLDLKKAVAEAIVEILAPIHEAFSKPPLREMREHLEKLVVTR
ncbi:MAG: tyrosine--tRNA ligase [Promethearchaeota archaeon]